jgi:hypothetical protein
MIQVSLDVMVERIGENLVQINSLEEYAVQQLKKQSGKEATIKKAWERLGYSSQKEITEKSEAKENLLGGLLKQAK